MAPSADSPASAKHAHGHHDVGVGLIGEVEHRSCAGPLVAELWNESCNQLRQRPGEPLQKPPEKRLQTRECFAAPALGNASERAPLAGMQLSHHHQRDQADAQGRPHDQQQELLVLVPARLAAVQARGPRLRGEGGLARRPLRARRAAAAVAFVPGAVAHPRRGEGVGYAGDSRVPGRDLPARPACCPSDRARARTAGRSAGRCTRASTICARPCP